MLSHDIGIGLSGLARSLGESVQYRYDDHLRGGGPMTPTTDTVEAVVETSTQDIGDEGYPDMTITVPRGTLSHTPSRYDLVTLRSRDYVVTGLDEIVAMGETAAYRMNLTHYPVGDVPVTLINPTYTDNDYGEPVESASAEYSAFAVRNVRSGEEGVLNDVERATVMTRWDIRSSTATLLMDTTWRLRVSDKVHHIVSIRFSPTLGHHQHWVFTRSSEGTVS